MIRSMTGFARVQRQVGSCQLCWELKSVNHRYLDVSWRLPEPFRLLEASLRDSLRGQLTRGKVDCQLNYQTVGSDDQGLVLNQGMVQALLKAASLLESDYAIANDLTVSRVLAYPGLLQKNQPDTSELAKDVLALFQDALTTLITARATEGAALNVQLEARLQALSAEVIRARDLVDLISGLTRAKLLNRLATLELGVNDLRIEQEVALLLVRLDVSEELDRLQAHVIEVTRSLTAEDASGRRLDFLMQELNREANTLSSKSDAVALTQCAVQMKVLIEQMREQIQNIE